MKLTTIITLLTAHILCAQETVTVQPKQKPKLPTVYDKSVPKPTLAGVKYGTHERNMIDFWQAKSDQPTPLVFFI